MAMDYPKHNHGADESTKYGCKESLERPRWSRVCHQCFGLGKYDFKQCSECKGVGSEPQFNCPVFELEKDEESESIYSLFKNGLLIKENVFPIQGGFLEQSSLSIEASAIIGNTFSWVQSQKQKAEENKGKQR